MAHRVAPAAELDLDDIWYYVAKESGSIEIANRLVDTITPVSSGWPIFLISADLATMISVLNVGVSPAGSM